MSRYGIPTQATYNSREDEDEAVRVLESLPPAGKRTIAQGLAAARAKLVLDGDY